MVRLKPFVMMYKCTQFHKINLNIIDAMAKVKITFVHDKDSYANISFDNR